MKHVWNRAFANGREEILVGDGPSRLLDACDRLLYAGADPGTLVEIPLLGAPSYDFLIALHGNNITQGCRLRDPNQVQAQGVVDWLASLDKPRPTVFFELDASGGGKLSGVHARIEGNYELASGLFRALGETIRTESFLQAVERLPPDWPCLYVAVFTGREERRTRLEVMPAHETAIRELGSVQCLGHHLEDFGFPVHSQSMLEDIVRLVRIGAPPTLQFDILPDGNLSPTLSLVSSYEETRRGFRSLWERDGLLARICHNYQDLGLSDRRWMTLEEGCFLAKRTTLRSEGVQAHVEACLPACTKVTWEKGARARAKAYVLLESRRIS